MSGDVLTNKYCTQCILFKSKDHIAARNETVAMNLRYLPKGTIKILFVAESPPWSFAKDRSSYFYAPEGKIGYGGLSYYIIPVFFGRTFHLKKDFLEAFMEDGFYLIDAVKCPINKLTRSEKEKAIKFCAKYLNEELRVLKFQKVIFVGKGTFGILKTCVNLQFAYDVVPFPFRSKRNVEGFKEGLKRALGGDV